MSYVQIHRLGLQDYQHCQQQMQTYTLQRDDQSDDQIWIVEHPAVYTLGLNGKPEHLLNTGDIPVVQSDRGGQVTYHGPGQLVVYLLLDLKRFNLMIKKYVDILQRSVIELLQTEYKLAAYTVAGAPGVYINDKKISALGVRVKRGCAYHGLSLNVAMDLQPFAGINPCGYTDLEICQLSDFGFEQTPNTVAEQLLPILMNQLNINKTEDKLTNVA